MVFFYVEQVLKILFFMLLGLASIADVKKLKILNIYPVSISIIFVLYAFFAKDISVSLFFDRFLFALIVLFLGFLIWLFHFWGAGDAKLFSAVVLWIEPKQFLSFLLVVAVTMGIIALFYWFFSFYKNKFNQISFKEIKGLKIPCAVSFFFGYIWVLVSGNFF